MTIDAEAVAFQWLQKRRVTYAQLMQLLDLLPATCSAVHQTYFRAPRQS